MFTTLKVFSLFVIEHVIGIVLIFTRVKAFLLFITDSSVSSFRNIV